MPYGGGLSVFAWKQFNVYAWPEQPGTLGLTRMERGGDVSFLSKTWIPNIFRYDKGLASHARIKLKISTEMCLHQSDKWPVFFYTFNQNCYGRTSNFVIIRSEVLQLFHVYRRTGTYRATSTDIPQKANDHNRTLRIIT
jgi:hypothetical protein